MANERLWNKFATLTPYSWCLGLCVALVMCSGTGCSSLMTGNANSLLIPSSEYGATWESPVAQYARVRHVQPNSVASEAPPEQSPENVEAVIARAIGLGEQTEEARKIFAAAEQMYQDAQGLREAAEHDEKELRRAGNLFVKASKQYLEAAEYWKDSALEEDALFMASEGYYAVKYYARVSELYRELLKKHEHTRHLVTIQRNRFAIAQMWLQADKQREQGFWSFNLTNESMPFNNRFDKALAILRSIGDDDPTSDLADDATMLMSHSYLRINKPEKAHETLTDLVKLFPNSEHQFLAHMLLLQTKIALYRGPEYSGVYLDQGEKLIRAMRRQFPDQAPQQSDKWDKFAKQIRYLKAEREWWVAQFYERKAEIGAARVYYREVAQNYYDTPFADRAFARLNELKNRPSKPTQPIQWLVDLFPDEDPVKPLIATSPDSVIR